MANKKMSSAELVNELEKAVKESKKLLELTNKTEDLYKDMAKSVKETFSFIDKETTKGLSDFNKALKTTNDVLEKYEKNNEERIKANEIITKQERELIKLRKKLNDELKEGTDESEKLKIQISEQNKLRKEAIRDSLGLVDAYSKESKVLAKMKKELKSTVIQMRRLGKSEEEVEKATKGAKQEIHKLDKELRALDKSLGDSYREVGKYEEALEDLESQMDAVSTIAKVIGAGKVLDFLSGALSGTIEFNREIDKTKEKIGNVGKAAAFSGVSSIMDEFMGTDAATNAFNKQAEASNAARDKLSESITKLKIEQSKMTSIWDVAAATPKVKGDPASDALDKELQAQADVVAGVKKEIKANEELAKVEFEKFKTLERLRIQKKEDSKETQAAINVLNKFTDDKYKNALANQEIERSISKLSKTQQELNIISEDDTRSYEERIAASDELIKTNKLIAKSQEKMAKTELELQTLNVAAQLVAGGRITEYKATILTSEDLNTLLKEEANQVKVTAAATEAYTTAYVEHQNAKSESSTTALDAEEKRSKLLSDMYERDLDILIDGADRIKSINERLMSDETLSNAKRKALLKETQDIMEKSFNKQAEIVVKFTKERIDLNEDLTKSEKDKLKANIDEGKIKELLAIKDSTLLNKKIRELGLSEIFEGRTLQLIIEKIQANQDLTESEKEILSSLRRTNELNKDILEQEEKLKKLRKTEGTVDSKGKAKIVSVINTQAELDALDEEYEEEQRQNRLEAIDEELKSTELGSEARAELVKEKNDILLDIEIEAAEKRIEEGEKEAKDLEELEKKKLAYRKKALEAGADLLEEIWSNAREKQEAALDSELDALSDRADQIRDAINGGNEDARNSLAEIEKQQVIAEQKKEKLRQREIRDRKIIAGLQILAANSDDPNPVGKTLGDIALLVASLDQVSGSFFDGTEDTGTVAKPLDSNGGRLSILHDNERVVTAKQNARIGSMSNDELADLAQMHNTGNLAGGSATIIQNNNRELVGKMDEVTKAIKSIPVQSYNYDAKAKFHEQVLESNNRKEIIKQKAKNLFK